MRTLLLRTASVSLATIGGFCFGTYFERQKKGENSENSFFLSLPGLPIFGIVSAAVPVSPQNELSSDLPKSISTRTSQVIGN